MKIEMYVRYIVNYIYCLINFKKLASFRVGNNFNDYLYGEKKLIRKKFCSLCNTAIDI